MFDIEYSDLLADERAHSNAALAGVKRLSLTQIQQLCESAYSAAESSYNEWFNTEREKLATAILKRGSSCARRLAAWMVGEPFARSHPDAIKLAEGQIAKYPVWKTNWQASDAARHAKMWLGVARNLQSFESFALSLDAFRELLQWAAKA